MLAPPGPHADFSCRLRMCSKSVPMLSRYVFRHLCFRRAHSVTESIPTPELPTGPVRVRFAPSPTGELHLGGLRTAMYNYLLAKRTNGTFVMRIEDTDQTRLVPGSAERLADALNWAGIPYDEGPSKDAGLGPYVQSERLPIYQQHAQQLLKNGHAYHCFCSEQRLESMAKLQAKTGIRTGYDRFCAGLTPSEVQAKLDAKIPYTIRMKVPDGAVEVHDIIRGRIEFSSDDVNDQVLLKADGFPTYHLANVVDDHLMKITHVIRGEEWLSSTPKHVLLYKSFGWTPPAFAHLPLLLNRDRRKLSKRDGASTVEAFRAMGNLPEALLNFVGLLGWNPGTDKELLSLSEMASQFDFSRVQRGGAIVDYDRLKWMNHHYIRQRIRSDLPAFMALVRPLILEAFPNANVSDAYLSRVIKVHEDRLHMLNDIVQVAAIFFVRPNLASSDAAEIRSKVWTSSADAKVVAGKCRPSGELMTDLIDLFEKLPESDAVDFEALKAFFKAAPATLASKPRDILLPFRALLTGVTSGSPLEEIIPILGRAETIARVRSGISAMHSSEIKL